MLNPIKWCHKKYWLVSGICNVTNTNQYHQNNIDTELVSVSVITSKWSLEKMGYFSEWHANNIWTQKLSSYAPSFSYFYYISSKSIVEFTMPKIELKN